MKWLKRAALLVFSVLLGTAVLPSIALATSAALDASAMLSGSTAPVDGIARSDDTARSEHPAPADTATPPVAVLLTDSLRWEDVSSPEFPELRRWAQTGALFNVIPPLDGKYTCPTSQIIAFATGQNLEPAEPNPQTLPCSKPQISAGGNLQADFAAVDITNRKKEALGKGAFGEILENTKTPFQAIGPAAGIYTANSRGHVAPKWKPVPQTDSQLAAEITAALAHHPLVVADTSRTEFSEAPYWKLHLIRIQDEGMNTASPEKISQRNRDYAAKNLEFLKNARRRNAARLNTILKEIPPGTLTFVISLDSPQTEPTLEPGFISWGLDPSAASQNTATQRTLPHAAFALDSRVKQPGTILANALAPSILSQLGVPGVDRFGVPPLVPSGANPPACNPSDNPDNPNPCGQERFDTLTSQTLRAEAIKQSRSTFFNIMIWVTIGYILGSLLAFIRPGWMRRFHAVAFWKYLGLGIAGVPIASHLVVCVVPWWSFLHPTLTLVGLTWITALFLAAVWWVVERQTRFPAAVGILALTFGFLAGDVVIGSPHLRDAPIGFNTLGGARFYGLGNEGFALLGTSALVLLTVLAAALSRLSCHPKLRHHSKMTPLTTAPAPDMRRPWLSHLVIFALGIGILALIAFPNLGADLGGALAFTCGFATLLLLLNRRSITPLRLVITGILAVLVAGGVSVLDWLRPPRTRTHLGNFVQSLVEGEAGGVILRKMAVNLRLLTISQHRWLVLIALLAVLLVVVPGYRKLRKIYRERWQTSLEATVVQALTAVAVCLVVAYFLNDSGIVLPGMASVLLMPLILPRLWESLEAQCPEAKCYLPDAISQKLTCVSP